MEDFRDRLLKLLFVEKRLNEEDAEKQRNMCVEEKVENNLILVDVTILNRNGEIYELNVPNNYSKLRVGDKISLKNELTSSECEATIIDIFLDTITVSCDKDLDSAASYYIEQKSPELLQTLISCLEGIYSGVPGAAFLRLLSGEEQFELVDFLKVAVEDIPAFDSVKDKLNEEQLTAVRSMLKYPPVHVLQGPPGTGKTLVLAATAIATAHMNREVVIIANTHHAVNNALQKIRSLDNKASIIKVGAELKAEELDDSILKFEKFSKYYEYSYQNRKKKKTGHIIGMTIWGAVTYLGLRHHAHFRPYIALVDEASLMPLSLATILGKTAPSVCLFGDSRQMPPIFRPELENNEFSVSILDYCAEKIEGVPVSVLQTTYRMNEEITEFVSENFYEPHGIQLISSDYSKDRHFSYDMSECEDERIAYILGSDGSVFTYDVSRDLHCQEYNFEEALFAAQIASVAMDKGMKASDIAIITPFRKQVNYIRSAFRTLGWEPEETPLVDTVERLQGQDVEMIIISMSVTDTEYYQSIRGFLLNPNRLNVMISRAKQKVVFLKSKAITDFQPFAY